MGLKLYSESYINSIASVLKDKDTDDYFSEIINSYTGTSISVSSSNSPVEYIFDNNLSLPAGTYQFRLKVSGIYDTYIKGKSAVTIGSSTIYGNEVSLANVGSLSICKFTLSTTTTVVLKAIATSTISGNRTPSFTEVMLCKINEKTYTVGDMAQAVNRIIGPYYIDDYIQGNLTYYKNITLSSLGYRAFAGCDNLYRIELPNLRSIPQGCFMGCSALKSVYLPEVSSMST